MECNKLILISRPLHAHGDAHPSSNAKGRHSLTSSSPLERVQQSHQHSAARHTDGMAQRNRTTTHIHLRSGQKGKMYFLNKVYLICL